MEETALKSMAAQTRPRATLLVGMLLAGVLWLAVDNATASGATMESVNSEPITLLATAEDGGGIDDVDSGGGFGATLGIVLGVTAVVAYGYMRLRSQ